MDLAYFDFDANTIRRRAEQHADDFPLTLTASEVNKIIKLVMALRVKYGIEPRDHMKDRPFQPGGSVLSGNTAGERDLAFGRQLVERKYRFATVPVLDEEEALRQRDEWLSVDPRKIRIGIPFNRWSEDRHHGRLAPGPAENSEAKYEGSVVRGA